MSDTRQEHWDKIFATKDEEAVSWFQVRPETSLRLIRACGLPKDARILDVANPDLWRPDSHRCSPFERRYAIRSARSSCASIPGKAMLVFGTSLYGAVR